MQLAHAHHPSSVINPADLDAYLANGWFRMGQTIFTTHILHYNNSLFSAIWLRIPLQEKSNSQTLKKLKKSNAAFRVEIREARLDTEKEVLFQKYKTGIPFEAAASVESLLYGKHFPLNVYNSLEILLYDGAQLIAAGFFDIGKESAAGISSFYDPDYKKYSLGKYLIHLKIEYCRGIGLRYFYPGYFVPGNPLFDYKLDIEKNLLEYYSLKERSWLPYPVFSTLNAPLEKMRAGLERILEKINPRNIPVTLFEYEFYNSNLIPEFSGLGLFDFPLFIYCFELNEAHINPILVYDIRDENYHIVQCESVFSTGAPIVAEEKYVAQLLKINHLLFSSPDIHATVDQLEKIYRSDLS